LVRDRVEVGVAFLDLVIEWLQAEQLNLALT
jgi:hypothetical protein